MKVKSLAVLSMAAVGFLVGCGEKDTADKKFVDNINKVIENSKGKINTTYDAEKLLNEAGYSVENKLANKQLKLAFDIDSKCFIAMEGNNAKYAPKGYKINSDTYRLYQVTDYYDANSKYSQYLTSSFEDEDELLITTGLDMGRNKNVKNIQYYSPTSTKKDVYLNLSCDYLDVYAPNDSIKHYGSTNNIFISSSSENISFTEYGSIAYIQTGAGEFNFEADSKTDIFEIVEGANVTVHQNEDAHVTGAINASTVATDAEIRYTEASNAAELLLATSNSSTKNFIRLTGDADVTYELDEGIKINRSLFIDLNGRSIKFKANDKTQTTIDNEDYYYGILLENTEDNPYINCIILDSQSRLYDRSGIYMDDCSFIVHGTQEGDDINTTNVILNIDSGKIHCEKKQVGPCAGVMVIGNTAIYKPAEEEDRPKKNATLSMYGGCMRTQRHDGSDPDAYSFKCIQGRGDGAYIYVSYGDIVSNNFCISTQGKANSNGCDKEGGVNILIEGGTFVGGTEPVKEGLEDYYSYTPFFFNVRGVYTITDANVTGPTCINIKRGNLTITGGTFNAIGNHTLDKGGQSGSVADGSVLVVESNKYYYESPVDVKISDAVMTSKYKYITNILPYDCTGQLDHYPTVNVTHNSGTFTYHEDGSSGYEDVGVYFSPDLIDEDVHCFADSSHGTWIQK